jgi:hypothetical protein
MDGCGQSLRLALTPRRPLFERGHFSALGYGWGRFLLSIIHESLSASSIKIVRA